VPLRYTARGEETLRRLRKVAPRGAFSSDGGAFQRPKGQRSAHHFLVISDARRVDRCRPGPMQHAVSVSDWCQTNLFDEVVTVASVAALHVITMVRYLLTPAAAAIAAQLAGCAYQPVPAYSYYPVPCPPTVAADALAPPNPASPVKHPSIAAVPPSASPASAPAATGAPPAPASNCVLAVPNYYAAGYAPYWDDGWPYYAGIGFGGFIGGRFHRDFHDHDFHGVRHAGSFHAGGHFGGDGHGGGGHGR
jgi:hypothetical protein